MRTTTTLSRAGLAIIALGALAFAVDSHAQANGPSRPRGRNIFRFETFGSDQLWTDVFGLHQLITDAVDPLTALGLGLKVDVDALPQDVITALENDDLDLEDPATTIELLRLGAVVGVIGTVENGTTLTRVGITCALCHSTVDDSFGDGIGHRLDGWPNRDLDVGTILSLLPMGLDDATKAEVADWGPGRYDARHHAFNGTELEILNADSLPIPIPAIYGLKGVNWEIGTGDGPISYWNRYVAVSQMGGQGDFVDDRIDLDIDQSPDLVAPTLPALLRYQQGLKAPRPPLGSFNRRAAARGRRVFDASCASCHVPPLYTDVNDNADPSEPLLHDPAEVDQDEEYADRSATGAYRTTPLRALWQHPPYFHDGSAPDLEAVVEHYDDNDALDIDLTAQEKADLIEFLKSL